MMQDWIEALDKILVTNKTNDRKPMQDICHSLCDFLQVLQAYPDHTLEQLRHIEHTVSLLKKVKPRREASELWSWLSDVTVHLVCSRSLPAVQPRVSRKLLKFLVQLEKSAEDEVYESLSHHTDCLRLKTATLFEDLHIWSQLLEVSEVARRHAHDAVVSFVSLLAAELSCSFITDNINTVEGRRFFHILIRMVLQLVQCMPEHCRRLMWEDGDVSCAHMNCIVIHLLKTLNTPTVGKDCQLLAGTTISFLLCSHQSSELAITYFLWIFHNLDRGDVGEIWRNAEKQQHLTSVKNGSALSFGHLSLIGGILSCGTVSLLRCAVPKTTVGSQSLCEWIFSIVNIFCNTTGEEFHAFKLLVQWFQQIAKSRAALAVSFLPDSDVTQNTLHLVWTHLDCPVEGVNEYAIDAFKMLLELNKNQQRADQKNSETQMSNNTVRTSLHGCLSDVVLAQVLDLPWHAKGKHNLLAVLMQHTQLHKVSEACPDLFEQLINCMSTNYLAPSATCLYKAVVLKLSRNDVGSSLSFTSWCMPWLTKALASSNNLLCHNVGQHWLPWTLQNVAGSFGALMTCLQESFQVGSPRGVITLLKVGRGCQQNVTWPHQLIRQCMVNADNAVRMDTFTLICASPKTSESLSGAEIELLKFGLPLNMNCDSAPFRQQLQICLQRALARARDAGLAQCRQLNSHNSAGGPHRTVVEDGPVADEDGTLAHTIDFVEWLWHLCMENMGPASSFQRIKTSLDWLCTVLNTFTYFPTRDQRKCTCPKGVRVLVRRARAVGKWDFFCRRHSDAILACVLNGTDDIRELAASILTNFFSWPLQFADDCDDGSRTEESEEEDGARNSGLVWPDLHREQSLRALIEQALQLCNCPRAQETQSGALLCGMIYEKCICHGMCFQMEFAPNHTVRVTGISRGLPQLAASHFFHFAVDALERSLQETHQNVLSAANHLPAHGLLLACHRCLLVTGRGGGGGGWVVENVNKWQSLFQRLISISNRIIDRVLGIMGGKCHTESAQQAPSFEQMSVSIAHAISSCVGESETETGAGLSNEHQLMMTWCWLCIKEASMLLGCLPEAASVAQPAGDVLSASQTLSIGQTFVRVLMTCRHRGAIESCNIGFLQYCAHLLASSDPQLCLIPARLLRQTLKHLTSSEASSSVTRRSAGLPLIVQSIVASEGKTRQSSLLNEAVTCLLDVLRQPVTSDPNETIDLPPVHAANILKAVFRESRVAVQIRPHVAPAVMCAVDSFASPLWAVRNAATHLFGTLVARMLGQKKSKDCDLNTTTAPEFFAQYPQLRAFLLRHVTMATGDQSQSSAAGCSLRLQPCLFPVLSILAKLGTGVTNNEGERLLQQFRQPVLRLAASPLHAVRALSARALVGLVPQQQTVSFTELLLHSLPASARDVCSYNRLHGHLCQLQQLVKHLPARVTTTDDRRRVHELLMSRSWLAGVENPCHALRAQYIELLIAPELACGDQQQVAALLRGPVNQLLNENDRKELRLDGRRYDVVLATWWLTHGNGDDVNERIAICLSDGCRHDVISATLSCLSGWLTGIHITADICWQRVQVQLFALLLRPIPWRLLCELLELTFAVHSLHHVRGTADMATWNKLLSFTQSEAHSRPAALAVAVMGTIFAKMKLTGVEMLRWCEMLVAFSANEQTEEARHSVAEVLCNAGSEMITNQIGTHDALQPCLHLFQCTLTLLMDESAEVRQKISDFILQMSAKLIASKVEHKSINSAYALEVFGDIIAELMRSFDELPSSVTDWLISLLQTGSSLSDIISTEPSVGCRSEDMFEAQGLNPYEERIILHSWSVKCLLTMLKSRPSEAISVCRLHTDNVCNQLEQAVTAFGMVPHMRLYLNMTCEKRVYEALHGVLSEGNMLAQLLTQSSDSTLVEGLGGQLHQAACHLQQIRYLHPGLQKKVRQIISTLSS